MGEGLKIAASDGALLAAVQTSKRAAVDAERELMIALAAYVGKHSVVDRRDAATLVVENFGDRELPLAGPGAPLVSEAAALEVAPMLGRTKESGKKMLGLVIECRYRLEHVWARVLDGTLEAWKARQIAAETIALDADVAAWVDQQIGDRAHKVTIAQVRRMVADAAALFEPDVAAAIAEETLQRHHVDVGSYQPILVGPSDGREQGQAAAMIGYVHAELDAADALDLERAIAAISRGFLDDVDAKDLPLDQRRAKALGVLARGYNAGTHAGAPGFARELKLVIHTDTPELAGTGLVRVANTRGLATLERLTEWAAVAGTVIRPILVVDASAEIIAEGYEPTAAQRRQIELTHETCVYPYCNTRIDHCDLDHVVAYADGGETSTSNLAPLCRTHHRLKTHVPGWSYRKTGPTTYVWTTPHGHLYRVTQSGTEDITAELADTHEGDPAAA